MTTATTSDQLEQRLNHLVKASLKLRFHHTIEIQPNTNSVFITYVRTSWNNDDTKQVQSICDEFGLEYQVVPLDNKLAVTLY